MSGPGRFCLEIGVADGITRGDAGVHVVDGLYVGCSGHVATASGAVSGAEQAGVIAAGYRRAGERLSAEVLGQYAAVVVDPERRTVLLIQDSLGVRTLYYRLGGGTLSVASDLKLLLAAMPGATVDESYFAHYLAFGARPFGRTPYRGVERLALGRTVVVQERSTRQVYPWTPPEATSTLDPDDAASRLRSLLEDAVAATLPRSGKVLCELSGGLDSSTVTVMAHRQRPDVAAMTFTSGSGRASDDASYARDVVAQLGIAWFPIDQDHYPLFSVLPDMHEAQPGGEMRTALRRAYHAFLAAEQIDVVLTGSGGDQTFGSMDIQPVHIADDVLRGNLVGAWRAARDWQSVGSGVRSETFWFANFGLRAALRHIRGQSLVSRRPLRRPAWLSDGFATAHGVVTARPQVAHRVSRPSRQYLWEMLYQLAESESSAANFEPPSDIRHPLFHRPFVEFMVSLEPSLRRGTGGERVLQRRALDGVLPDRVLSRETKGSNQMLREQTFLHSEEWTRRLLENPCLVQRGWVVPDAWRTAVERARYGVVREAPGFDAAMCAEMWLQTHDQRLSAPPPEFRVL